MPPGAMTISMSADDLSSSSIFHRAGGNRKVLGEVPHVRPIRTDHRFVEDNRYRRIRERSLDKSILSSNKQRDREATNGDHRENMRDGSWNRRQKRGTSKERGGTQLPTWAETRTTRLRRSRALGENSNSATSQQKKKREASRSKTREPPPPRHPFDAEDEAEEEEPGKILMDRIRANSRCLKAQFASRKTVSDTGTASAKRPSRERKAENHKNGKGHNGVYTMHARKNRKGGNDNEEQAEGTVEVETTAVKLLDEQGNEISEENPVTLRNDEPKEEPEIVHQHTLSVDGQDGRMDNMAGNEEPNERHPEALEDIAENSGSRESSESNNQTESDAKEANSEITDSDYNRSDIKEDDSERSQNSRNDSDVNASTNDLEEGRLVNQNGKLTIEVEVKELGSSKESGDTPLPSATLESNLTPIPIDDTGEYDSYRVYSEQNLASSSVEAGQGESSYPERHSRADASRSDEMRMKKAREARGVYLRRMEHRKSQSNVSRTQSNEQGLDSVSSRAGDAGSPVRRYGGSVRSFSQNRKSGQSRLEKWSTSAASTGDLREAAWDYSYDKERLRSILSEVRNETRIRQRQREELLRRIKQLQSRAHQRREQVREMWRKRYLEAKKITPRIEEECSRLRQELEKLHRELLAKVQAGVWALLTISGKTERPSNKLSYKIMIARLLQEIEDLTRRVEGTRLKLHTEIKLRSMAEKDVRNLREELLKKKIQVTLTRNQEQAAMGNGLRQQYFISAV
ncbi:Spermatogenesis-associated protein 1, partial [Stegodyphus mimosarum]